MRAFDGVKMIEAENRRASYSLASFPASSLLSLIPTETTDGVLMCDV